MVSKPRSLILKSESANAIYHAHSENDVSAVALNENDSSIATDDLNASTTTTITTTLRTPSSRHRKAPPLPTRFTMDGARYMARKLKRLSLIESSSSNSSSTSSNSNSKDINLSNRHSSADRIILETEAPNGFSHNPNGGKSTSNGIDESTTLESGVKLRQHYSSTPSLRHSGYSNSLNPLVTVQSNSSIRSNASSGNNSVIAGLGNINSNTAKQHDQQMAAAAAGISSSSSGVGANSTAPEKEKKRKEVSSSRVKKFHRHFQQVPKDEKLINYFSCALVSDILLQGHLYITDKHFAFYSNVFGYVTKVVIPTSSVTKISKEKTAKIIPNAVGVATADERHVFGSFISRESAFRLMCSVCPPLAPVEILPKVPADIEISEEYSIEDDSSCSISGNESPPQLLDASGLNHGGVFSCGNIVIIADDNQQLIRRSIIADDSQQLIKRSTIADDSYHLMRRSIGDSTKPLRHSSKTVNAGGGSGDNSNSLSLSGNVAMRCSAPPGVHHDTDPSSAAALSNDTNNSGIQLNANDAAATPIGLIIAGSISSSSTSNISGSSANPSTSSSPTTVVVGNTATSSLSTMPRNLAHAALKNIRSLTRNLLQRIQQNSELHILYLGVMLAVILALFSVFLLYRILDIEAKTNLYQTPVDFNWRTGNDEDIFAEALRWQKELQAKTAEEAQTILSKNLEQISKVRRSLETLSMLIHDRSTAYGGGGSSNPTTSPMISPATTATTHSDD